MRATSRRISAAAPQPWSRQARTSSPRPTRRSSGPRNAPSSTPPARRCSRSRARCMRKGYKAVLTGEGADEAFAGYVWFKIREAARTLDIGDSFRPSTAISRVARKCGGANLELRRVRAHRRHDRRTARAVDHLQSRGDVARPLLQRRAERAARRSSSPMRTSASTCARMRRWHPLNRSLYLGYKVQLAGLLLTQKGDRVAMANSVETRYPFLDEDVIAFASRIHPRWKLRGVHAATNICCGRPRRACCPTRWPSGRRPCSARRSPRPSSPTRRAFVRDLMSPKSLARTRLFRCRRACRRDCAVLAKGEAQARHLREPRPRRRGRHPALASPLSRRRIVRPAACRASGRGRACGRKAGASALSGPCSAMKRLRIARAGPPVSTLVMTVAGSGFFSAVRCNSYGQRR